MTNRVRVGVVGTSWWSDLMFLPSLKSHPQAEVAAICGRNPQRTEEMALKYAIPKSFADYRRMIREGDLQALVVATPDDLHYPIVLSALEAGLHVLCEKPLASTAAQAEEMVRAAEAAGVKHMVLFTWRWMPHFQHLHDLVAGGYIGRWYEAHFDYRSGYARAPEYAWRFDRRRANGCLGDLGSHMIDFARWTVGEIVKVSAIWPPSSTAPGLMVCRPTRRTTRPAWLSNLPMGRRARSRSARLPCAVTAGWNSTSASRARLVRSRRRSFIGGSRVAPSFVARNVRAIPSRRWRSPTGSGRAWTAQTSFHRWFPVCS